MLFVNDIILIDKICEEVNIKIEFWRETFEVKCFKLSR